MVDLSDGAHDGHRQEANQERLRPGDAVAILVDGTSVPCVVAQEAKGSVVLLPLDRPPSLDRALGSLPIAAQVKTNNGKANGLLVRSARLVLAIVGDLRQIEPRAERRQSFRITLDFKVQMSTGGVFWEAGSGRNISETGLLVLTDNQLDIQVGDYLYMDISLPQASPITATGKVVRTAPRPPDALSGTCMLGIQFVSMAPQHGRTLTQFIYQFQARNMQGKWAD